MPGLAKRAISPNPSAPTDARSPVALVIAPHPFTPKIDVREVEEGVSLSALLRIACVEGGLSVSDLPRTEIYINGDRLVDRFAIRDIRPAAGDIVNIVVLPQGSGGGGRKNPLEVALQLAVMVGAFAIAGPGGPLAQYLAAQGIGAGVAAGIEIATMASCPLQGVTDLSRLLDNAQ